MCSLVPRTSASVEGSVPRGLFVPIPLQFRGLFPTKASGKTGLVWHLAVSSFFLNEEAVPTGAGDTKPMIQMAELEWPPQKMRIKLSGFCSLQWSAF